MTSNKLLLNKDNKFEKDCYGAFFQRKPFFYLRQLLDKNKINLTGRSILIAGCGLGKDVYYLEKFYMPKKVYLSDIKREDLLGAISLFPYSKGIVSNNQMLSFKDNSIDYVIVGTCLHHLKEPVRGLYELLRITKYALIVNEPNDTWLTRFFERLGWAQEYEIEHRNYVYRFRKREVEKICKALFFSFGIVRFFSTHRVAKTKLEFWVLKLLNVIGNILCPSLGNYIIFVIKKEQLFPKCLRGAK